MTDLKHLRELCDAAYELLKQKVSDLYDQTAEMQAAITELREGAAALLLMGDQEPLKQALDKTKKWSE